MLAILLPGGRRVEVVEIAEPAAGPGEVRVRVRASAICGTDLHHYREDVLTRAPAARLVSGHEPVGEVESVGPGVAWPEVGDRVVVYHVVGCQTCDACRAARFKRCAALFERGAMASARDGAIADYISVPASNCIPFPTSFSCVVVALLGCIFGSAYGALRCAR